MPCIGKRGGNLPEREGLALAPPARELVRELDHFRPIFRVAAPAADLLACLCALAIARRFHLRDVGIGASVYQRRSNLGCASIAQAVGRPKAKLMLVMGRWSQSGSLRRAMDC